MDEKDAWTKYPSFLTDDLLESQVCVIYHVYVCHIYVVRTIYIYRYIYIYICHVYVYVHARVNLICTVRDTFFTI